MLLELKEVYGGYGNGDIVKGVSCSADHGDVLCLVGPNGCGKTTLFRLMLGSIPTSKGSIMIDGRDTKSLSSKELAHLIAYIPQYHSPIFAYTVLDVVIMGRASHFSAFETPKTADREAAFAALEKVNALHLANKKYTALSGGQRQLILIARAICNRQRYLLWMNRLQTLTTQTTSFLWKSLQTLQNGATASSCRPIVRSTRFPLAARSF